MTKNAELVQEIVVQLSMPDVTWEYNDEEEHPTRYEAYFDGWSVWRNLDAKPTEHACGVALDDVDRLPFTRAEYRLIEAAVDYAWQARVDRYDQHVFSKARSIIMGVCG